MQDHSLFADDVPAIFRFATPRRIAVLGVLTAIGQCVGTVVAVLAYPSTGWADTLVRLTTGFTFGVALAVASVWIGTR